MTEVLEHICDQYSVTDPFFVSLQTDYPDFLKWYQSCKDKKRPCWVIQHKKNSIAALIIYKSESTKDAKEKKELQDMGVPGNVVLKLCLFKVGDGNQGEKYGELLLKRAMNFSYDNDFDTTYLTVFPKHTRLITLIEKFGFKKCGTKGKEDVYFKFTKVGSSPDLSKPFEFHKNFWPRLISKGVDKYFIPIIPEYHNRLFPEAAKKYAGSSSTAQNLPQTPGNAIRKVYVCNSMTTSMKSGSLVFFYRSQTSAITSIGVLESYHIANDFKELKKLADRRSVYTDEELTEKTKGSEKAKVVNFYYARDLKNPVTLTELKAQKVITAQPQSITKISEAEFQKFYKNCLSKADKEIFYD